MRCTCGGKTQTKDTRQWRDDRGFDWVERRRVCVRCNQVQKTIEIPKSIWGKYTESECELSNVL
jgi:hypothetical protein